LFVFDQFTEIYTCTDNEIEAIDIVCLKDFIKNLNIKKLQINKNYYIKPIFKYDIVLNSTNKTSKELVKELC